MEQPELSKETVGSHGHWQQHPAWVVSKYPMWPTKVFRAGLRYREHRLCIQRKDMWMPAVKVKQASMTQAAQADRAMHAVMQLQACKLMRLRLLRTMSEQHDLKTRSMLCSVCQEAGNVRVCRWLPCRCNVPPSNASLICNPYLNNAAVSPL